MKKLMITGNVGRKPEIKQDQKTGENFIAFTVAVSVGTKQNPKTDWVNVSCSSKHLIDLVQNYVDVGQKILVEGFPAATAWVDKSGSAVAMIRLYANVIELLSSKKKDDNSDNGSDYEHPPF